MQVVDLPINKIKVINPLRKIDESNVEGLMTSIKEVSLLHPIQVAKRGDEYIILSGNHRREAFSRLGREVIPAVVREDDELVNQLVSIEENIVSKKSYLKKIRAALRNLFFEARNLTQPHEI